MTARRVERWPTLDQRVARACAIARDRGASAAEVDAVAEAVRAGVAETVADVADWAGSVRGLAEALSDALHAGAGWGRLAEVLACPNAAVASRRYGWMVLEWEAEVEAPLDEPYVPQLPPVGVEYDLDEPDDDPLPPPAPRAPRLTYAERRRLREPGPPEQMRIGAANAYVTNTASRTAHLIIDPDHPEQTLCRARFGQRQAGCAAADVACGMCRRLSVHLGRPGWREA